MQSVKSLLTWSPTSAEREIIETTWPSEVEVLVRDELDEATYESALPAVDVMVGYMRTIPKDRLADARSLRMIHVLGHGVDALLTPRVRDQLLQRGVKVARSNPCAIAIAEFVIMGMIALSRRAVPLHNALTLRGDWSTELWARRGEGVLGGELSGATVGIIGYGHIGTEVHRRAAAFGMHVGAIARRPEELAEAGLDLVHRWDDLEEFLGLCDHVVLTLPLTPETRGLLGRDQLAAMREGAFLINVSRGPLVDEDALWEALESGRLGGAALDVFTREETHGRSGYPTERPLHQFNTLLTPHYSGATAEARMRALTVVGENLANLAASRPLLNEARLDRGF